MCGEQERCCRVLVEKLERKRPLGRHRRICKLILKLFSRSGIGA
jgi:hypothetical protein